MIGRSSSERYEGTYQQLIYCFVLFRFNILANILFFCMSKVNACTWLNKVRKHKTKDDRKRCDNFKIKNGSKTKLPYFLPSPAPATPKIKLDTTIGMTIILMSRKKKSPIGFKYVSTPGLPKRSHQPRHRE